MCKKVWPTYFLFFFEQVLVILLIITFYQKKGTYINCSKLLLPLPQRVVSQAIKVIPPKLNDDKTERDNSKVYKYFEIFCYQINSIHLSINHLQSKKNYFVIIVRLFSILVDR